MHQSFINYRSQRYGFIALGMVIAAALAYAIRAREEAPNGGTVLGYTLGTVAALLVAWLAFYGVRRRSFRSVSGSASAWLSAHVYLGIASLVIATFHSAFRLGLNVHTAAYALLAFVVLSGCWGVYAYARYPGLMVRRRGNVSRETLLEQLTELDDRARQLAGGLDDALQQLIAEAIRRTQLGGGVWSQLRARDRSAILVAGSPSKLVSNEGQHVLIERLAHEHALSHDERSTATLQELLEVAGSKAVVVGKLQKDIQLQALVQFWLYVHLPLCFGLLTALVAHVVAVFFYW